MMQHQVAVEARFNPDELENVWPLVPPGASNSEMLEKLS